MGFQSLEAAVQEWTPQQTTKLTGVSRADLEAAAEVLGSTETLVSTVLQGVYQSFEATATAVQVNNLHLVRGLIGKQGATVFQMNGTTECAEHPGMRRQRRDGGFS